MSIRKPFLKQNFDILERNVAEVQRYYPVFLEKRQQKPGEANNAKMEDSNAHHLWLVRIAKTEEGGEVAQALRNMEEEGPLKDQLGAEYRPDHGPRGSMAKALGARLHGVQEEE